jgi:hypothetical protein
VKDSTTACRGAQLTIQALTLLTERSISRQHTAACACLPVPIRAAIHATIIAMSDPASKWATLTDIERTALQVAYARSLGSQYMLRPEDNQPYYEVRSPSGHVATPRLSVQC